MWLRLAGVVEEVNSSEGSQCTYACCPTALIADMLSSKKVSLCSALKPCWAPLGCPNLKRNCFVTRCKIFASFFQDPMLDDLIWWKKLIRFAVYRCLQYKRNTWNWSSPETWQIDRGAAGTHQIRTWHVCRRCQLPGAQCTCQSLHSMKGMNASLKTTTLHLVWKYSGHSNSINQPANLSSWSMLGPS